MEKVKLIWDFRGPDAKKIAEHHAIHLNDFLVKENLENCEVGLDSNSAVWIMAFVICPKSVMITLRDALKPHRGEVYG